MTRLFIGNLPYDVGNQDLAEQFEGFERITSIEVVMDRQTGRSRGFAFAQIDDAAEAANAIAKLNGVEIDGRAIVVSEAPEREMRPQFRDPSEEPSLASLDVTKNIIEITTAISVELIKHFARNPADLLTVDRRRFEEIIAELWDGFGYAVELTQRTRDGGKDIVAVRNTIVAERYLIECKRPDVGNPIGIRPFRELYGVKVSDGATKAVLATTAYFTKDAIHFFERHKWELEGKDFEGLMEWITEYLIRKGEIAPPVRYRAAIRAG